MATPQEQRPTPEELHMAIPETTSYLKSGDGILSANLETMNGCE
jgi:hypothetical protein